MLKKKLASSEASFYMVKYGIRIAISQNEFENATTIYVIVESFYIVFCKYYIFFSKSQWATNFYSKNMIYFLCSFIFI